MGAALDQGTHWEAAGQARAHRWQWLWQCRARLRSGCAGVASGEAAVGPARAAVARADGCSDGGSERLRCWSGRAVATGGSGLG